MIAYLKNSFVALIVFVLALVAQIPHAAYVFDATPHVSQMGALAVQWSWLAYCYAIALESATLMFVVHGKQLQSYGFATASFLVNLAYYYMQGVELLDVASWPAWLVSLLLPIAIASYSHIIASAEDVKLQWPEWIDIAMAWMRLPIASSRVVESASSLQPSTPPIATVQPQLQPDATPIATPLQFPATVQPQLQPDATPIATPLQFPATVQPSAIALQPVHAIGLQDDENMQPNDVTLLQPDARERAKQLKLEGLTNKQIAGELQVDPSTVGRWLRNA